MECWKNFNSLDDWVKAVSGLQLLQLEISSAQGSCINALMSMNALLGWPRKAINISVYVCMPIPPTHRVEQSAVRLVQTLVAENNF